MSRRARWAAGLLALAVVAAGVGAWQWRALQAREAALAAALLRQLPAQQNERIARGASLAQIARQLSQNGLPATAAEFMVLARRGGVAAKLQAGNYRFAAGQTVAEVLQDLADGNVLVEKITFVEGITYADLRAQIGADKRIKQTPTLTDAALLATLGISAKSLEGQFLPATYFFDADATDLSILRRAHLRLKETLAAGWEGRADGGVYKTPYEALILASIIEKETGRAGERARIASVFVNRLKGGVRLQADPTVIYGLGDAFDGNLTRAHLRQKTPYNTYARGGLPPTPIALPGKAAISAALAPEDSAFYYFVANGDGGHVFSKTLREHNNAVNRYQRGRGKKL